MSSNTSQHDTTRVQHETTQMHRDPARVQRKLWQQN